MLVTGTRVCMAERLICTATTPASLCGDTPTACLVWLGETCNWGAIPTPTLKEGATGLRAASPSPEGGPDSSGFYAVC